MKQLLVATDLTQGAARATARAIRLAAATGAAIHLVHAVPWSASLESSIPLRKRILTEARLMAEEMIDRELDISVTISHHRPGEAILDQADRHDAELILLGPHGEVRLRDAIFGTTASHVIRHSDRPVLIVQNGGALPYAKIVVALDDPGSARPVLERALAIAPAAEVFAVHAFDPPPTPFWGPTERRREQALRREAEIEAFLRETATGRAPAVSAAKHAFVETGDVGTILMVECFHLAPDLLAMGRHHRSPLLGNHAVDSLSWCHSDILIVPDGEQPLAVETARAAWPVQ